MQSPIYACQMTAKDRLIPKRRMKNTSRLGKPLSVSNIANKRSGT